MTLATRLPYSHPFAGGYPRIGGQPLPTDPDAIDYLQRQAAVDGPVEVGVAMAVDAFVRGCKADGIWSAIKASCIMAGARTLTGALVPLKGTAPTPYNFASDDYDRSTGLKGDGSTTYLDTNRANNADGQDDKHIAAYSTEGDATNGALMGAFIRTPALSVTQLWSDAGSVYGAINAGTGLSGAWSGVGLVAASASNGTHSFRRDETSSSSSISTNSNFSSNLLVFARYDVSSVVSHYSGRLAFYSIGSALDLAALDTRVSTLISSISTALS